MTEPTAETLTQTLRELTDPVTGRDVVAAGLIDSLQVRDGLVHLSLIASREAADRLQPLRAAAQALLARQPGVRNAAVVLTAHRPDPPPPPPPAPGRDPNGRPKLLQQVGAVVAVASGKGGVGKSTTAVNVAIALARLGLRTGLLDADIHGPSLPRMLGTDARPEVRAGMMIPLELWGLRAMSVGFMVDQETPMVWRGPMVMGALEQLMGQVAWGDLDIMIVDMPPGTGDAQLTMAQRVALAGALIVSTPQDVALIDARRGVRMFEKTGVPVLGLIENMSFFHCPACGARSDIFGHGGARAEAARLGVDFLGEIPLLLDVRIAADAGTPIAATAPDSIAGQSYTAIAHALRQKLGLRT